MVEGFRALPSGLWVTMTLLRIGGAVIATSVWHSYSDEISNNVLPLVRSWAVWAAIASLLALKYFLSKVQTACALLRS